MKLSLQESLVIFNLPRLQKLLHILLKCYRHDFKIKPSTTQIHKTGAETRTCAEISAGF
jgi:hypothetical protein